MIKTKIEDFLSEHQFDDWSNKPSFFSNSNDDEDYGEGDIDEVEEMTRFRDILSRNAVVEDDEEDKKPDKRDLTFDTNRKIVKIQKLNNITLKRTYVGYWATYDEVWYGKPNPNWEGWKDKNLYNTFIEKLSKKLESGRKNGYKGWSDCRICKTHNGCMEYNIDIKRKGDDMSLIVVPDGYMHYITKHKIEPHKWFLEYIINS